jgi:hypothetical protein
VPELEACIETFLLNFYEHVHVTKPHLFFPPRLQWAGAAGCVFVNADDDLFTYIPYLVPVNISIPFFNVMNAYGSALITRIQTGQTVNITEALSYWCMRP